MHTLPRVTTANLRAVLSNLQAVYDSLTTDTRTPRRVLELRNQNNTWALYARALYSSPEEPVSVRLAGFSTKRELHTEMLAQLAMLNDVSEHLSR